MNSRLALGGLAALFFGLMSAAASAQTAGITGSPLPDQPYTLIYPSVMVTSGDLGGPVTLNHPAVPLQCVLAVIPVEDIGWTADGALATLDAAAVTAGWAETLPGFVLGTAQLAAYQSDTALQYEGVSAESGENGPVTLVHTETVAQGNGYTLDCFYPPEVAEQARPIVDSIIANFSTKQDAQPIAPVP